MSWNISFSFLLVKLTQHCRDRFGNRHCQISSISWKSMNSYPLFSFAGMVLLVYRDALFGTRVREPARVSFMLWAAQVSLDRAVTLLRKAHFFLILEDFRATHYWTWLMRCVCEFRSWSAQFFRISQNKMCHQVCRLIELLLLFHIRQEFLQHELPDLVQWLCLREYLPKLEFSDNLENSNILGTEE